MKSNVILPGLVLVLSATLSSAQQVTPGAPFVETAPGVTVADAMQHFSQNEDWSALPLAKSGLNTSSYVATVIAKSETPEFTRELVRVQWRPADPIDLYVVMPHGVSKPPAILYLYDYRFDTERFRDDGWCQRATRDGFAAIAFGSALSAQRYHSRPMKEWFVSELQEALGESTHDVQMVLNYVATRGDIDMGRLGMIGEGSGGSIAVLAAAVDSRIKVLDLLNPWGDWPDWLKGSAQIPDKERDAYLKADFLAKVAGMDPATYLPNLHLKALRIQELLDDPVTPGAAREKLISAVPSFGVVVRYRDASEHIAAWRKDGLSGWTRSQLAFVGGQTSENKVRSEVNLR